MWPWRSGSRSDPAPHLSNVQCGLVEAREREEEAGQFADKEVFVTGAYRKQMEEVEVHKEAIARRDAIDAAQVRITSIIVINHHHRHPWFART